MRATLRIGEREKAGAGLAQAGYDRRLAGRQSGARATARSIQNLIQSLIQTTNQNIHYQTQTVSRHLDGCGQIVDALLNHVLTHLGNPHHALERDACFVGDGFPTFRPGGVLADFDF